ncbi:hypothetical protein ACCY16_20190 [Candidatus Pantoea formicae]|uniref:hypothetical protein n=1 Tax=Candidatus Pantoea formicae TaxID=2608355 RepID=UPI003ED98370
MIADQKVRFSADAGGVLHLLRCLPNLPSASKPVGDFLYFALNGVICKFGVALHKISRFNTYMQS